MRCPMPESACSQRRGGFIPPVSASEPVFTVGILCRNGHRRDKPAPTVRRVAMNNRRGGFTPPDFLRSYRNPNTRLTLQGTSGQVEIRNNDINQKPISNRKNIVLNRKHRIMLSIRVNLVVSIIFCIFIALSADVYAYMSMDNNLLANIHGFAKNETAYRIHSPSEFIKIKNILFLSTEGKLTPTIGYKASGRAYYDAVFDVTNTYTEHVEKDEEDDIELRETYLDFSIGNLDLRLGKQQIVWGEAVGLFFADVVNPKDLREFILPEFDQIRIPVWAADIEYYMGDNYLELVWIPILEFNELGVSGSEFEFYTTPAPSNVLVYYESEKEPSNSLNNSECGIRLSRLMAGWDLSGFYFYGYDYFPTLFRTIGVDPLTSQTTFTVKPEYKRLNIFGLTFAKEVEDVIFKGEFVYNQGKYFLVNDLTDSDGVVKKDFLDYLIGMDYTFFEKIDFNVQFMQRIIFNYADTIVDDEMKTSFSCWFKTGFFDNRLEPELFFVSSLRETDLMFSPKVSYKFKDNWTAAVGVDVFRGISDGEFGQFDAKDRTYIELRYDF